MADSDALLEVAAALADGTAVDWESALESVTSEHDRRLLAELRFVAGLLQPATAEEPVIEAPASIAAAQETPRREQERDPAAACWGPLRITERVGGGTFGDVYRAWDSRLDREVALKLLRRRTRDDDAQASTVIREGRLLARVRHPNVVTVYGAERIGEQVGLWMEFIDGNTLEQTVRDEGPFDLDRAIRAGIDLANALSAVHRAGLIHRDVKAQNVLSDGDGRLVLTDFGAGCELQETADGGTEGLAGTPVSVAPEVLTGQAATPQSDIYSLGVLIYHLVTGTYPVTGRSLRDVREAHGRGARTPLSAARPDLPAAFARVIDRAIDPTPANRYDTPDAFGSALASLRRAGPEPSTAADAVTAADPGHGVAWSRRQWMVVTGLAVAGTVAVWLALGSAAGIRPASGDGSRTAAHKAEVELTAIVGLTERGRLEAAYDRLTGARAALPPSPHLSTAAAYVLTYAGFLDDAARAVDAVLASDPSYLEQNGWWTPTVLLYQRRFDRFLTLVSVSRSPQPALYRALAELERGRTDEARTALAESRGQSGGGADVFVRLGVALEAGLATRGAEAGAALEAMIAERRSSGDEDGEVTFKQAQVLSIAGRTAAALRALDLAIAQGFVCPACIESSSLLGPVRALPEYAGILQRARARHSSFARRYRLQEASHVANGR